MGQQLGHGPKLRPVLRETFAQPAKELIKETRKPQNDSTPKKGRKMNLPLKNRLEFEGPHSMAFALFNRLGRFDLRGGTIRCRDVLEILPFSKGLGSSIGSRRAIQQAYK